MFKRKLLLALGIISITHALHAMAPAASEIKTMHCDDKTEGKTEAKKFASNQLELYMKFDDLIRYYKFEEARKIIEEGFDINYMNTTAGINYPILLDNAYQERTRNIVERIEFLLSLPGIQVNFKGGDGNTALHKVVQKLRGQTLSASYEGSFRQEVSKKSFIELVELLLMYGADPFIKNNERKDVFYYVRQDSMLSELIKKKRDEYLKNHDRIRTQLAKEKSVTIATGSGFSGGVAGIIAEYCVDEDEIFSRLQEEKRAEKMQ